MSDGFRILVVCTGNICRSPVGERLLAQQLNARLPDATSRFMVTSAGTYAGHRGEPMQPGAARVLSERGVASDGFRATALTPDLLLDTDLVLTAERSHVEACVRLMPAAARHTFTIKEFARLLGPVLGGADYSSSARDASTIDGRPAGDPVARARNLVLVAADLRSAKSLVGLDVDDDIDDPYAQPLAAFRRTADEIEAALNGWVGYLAHDHTT